MKNILYHGESFYITLAEASEDTVFIINKDGSLAYCNSFVVKNFNLKPEDLIGKTQNEIFPKKIAQKHIERFAKTFQTGNHDSYQDEFIINGKHIWFDTKLVPIKNDNGEVDAILGVSRDITKIKNAEESLLFRAEFEKLICSLSAEFITISVHNVDENIKNALRKIGEFVEIDCVILSLFPSQFSENDKEYKWCNEKYDSVCKPSNEFKVSKFDFIMERLSKLETIFIPSISDSQNLVIPENFTLLEKKVKSIVAIPMSFHGKLIGVISLCSFQNEHKWSSETISLFYIISEIFTNTFQHKVTLQKMEQLKEKLEQKVKIKTAELDIAYKELDSFAFAATHDLRAPLRIIKGYIKALSEDFGPSMPEEAMTLLNRISHTSEHMGRLIEGLIKMTSIANCELNLEDINLSQLAKSICTKLERSSPKRKVKFKITPGMKTCGDHNLIQILLEHLLENSWKFTDKNTETFIEFNKYNSEKGENVFFVRDNGAGFDMNYSDKLFHLFQRLHSQNDFPGAGTGLATAKRIVERHNGVIWGKGEISKGSTFSFTLSLQKT